MVASDPRCAEARATLARIMAADKIPSIAVAVAQDDRIIWQEAFGWANHEKQLRATPTTAYSANHNMRGRLKGIHRHWRAICE